MGGLVLVSGTARAAPSTWFLVESAAGLASGDDVGASPTLLTEVAAGATFKWHGVLFYTLLTGAFRSTSAEARFEGLAFETTQDQLDLFFAPRVVFPIYRGTRVYLELGSGARWTEGSIDRGPNLGTVGVRSVAPTLIAAAGLSFRPMARVSFGVRAELSSTLGTPSPLAALAGRPDSSRSAALFTVGLHF
ncbi:MAG: hypothetical protein HYV07_27970 [Deltaproteobacteria bacterium]|nr:hypothetical protein [Deltaproteobacteria bacterium]